MTELSADERLAWVRERLEGEGEAVLFDGLEAAIVGVAQQYTGPMLVVYSRRRILELLVAEGLTEEEALDHYGFNIADLWAGSGTPLILEELDADG